MQDEYGCVAYLPVSPSSEELELMCKQKSELIDKYDTLDEHITDEILTLMQKCYFLQRKEIHIGKDLSTIFQQWPFFYHYKFIVQHADELLGKDTNVVWKTSLEKLSKPINRWAKNLEVAREVKDKSKKNAVDGERKFVRDRLKLATKYSEQKKNDEPYNTVVFELIVKFMKENLTFLYNIIDESIEDAELLKHVPVVNPVLIIREFLNKILQQFFLQICPPKGTKRGGKRKATKIHPKVFKLTKDIDSYLADESDD
ncbi:uncharacterized protein LOC123662157 [Melitaea cinxia]|uniref:uncharacterized protein LOC123662157 n=1 Tax=Melitaea cinxia TaxID=113334 RepID=UPI001E26F3DB|nr:uncharacterized protein LOC123662157 [Melitaea cinxia]